MSLIILSRLSSLVQEGVGSSNLSRYNHQNTRTYEASVEFEINLKKNLKLENDPNDFFTHSFIHSFIFMKFSKYTEGFGAINRFS